MNRKPIGFSSALVLVLGISFSGALFSEEAKQAEPAKPQYDRFDMMSKRLGLDEKQKEKLQPMLEKLQKQRQETLKSLDENEKKELSTILDEDQSRQVQRFLMMSNRPRPEMPRERAKSRQPNPKPIYPIPPKEIKSTKSAE